MNYTKQVLRGSIYYFIGAVVAAFVAYLTKLVLVRNLSVEDYGLFFAVLTFVLIFSVFRKLGLSQGLARFIADYNVKKKHGEIKSIITGAFLMQIIVALFMVGVLWISADFLAVNYFKDARSVWLLRILAFYLPLSIIFVNYKSILQGLKKSKTLAITQTTLNILILLGVITGLWLGLEVFAPIIGYLGSFIVFFSIFTIPLLRGFNYFKHKHKAFKEENKKLIKFSLPLMITSIGALFITYFDTLMLTYYDTLANVGIYNIIYPTAILITMIGSSLGVILMPVITELWTQKKKTQITQALRIINKYLLIVCLPIIITLMMFSEHIIRIFFGQEYLAGVIAFNILLVGAMFKVFAAVYNQTLIAFKESKKTMKIFLFGAILNVALNAILIPMYSLNGAAIASATSFLAMMILALTYTSKKIRIISPWKSWITTIIASMMIPITPMMMNKYIEANIYATTITGLIIGGIIYLIVLYKLRIIDAGEIKQILKK